MRQYGFSIIGVSGLATSVVGAISVGKNQNRAGIAISEAARQRLWGRTVMRLAGTLIFRLLRLPKHDFLLSISERGSRRLPGHQGALRKRFLVQSLFVGRKRSIHCGPPFSGSARLSAWCIRSGCPYRKTYTACNCEVRRRNWGTSPAGQWRPAATPRRKHSARQNAGPACWESADRTFQASSAAAAQHADRRRSPCSPAAYTSFPLQNLFVGIGENAEDARYHHRTIAHSGPAEWLQPSRTQKPSTSNTRCSAR